MLEKEGKATEKAQNGAKKKFSKAKKLVEKSPPGGNGKTFKRRA